jgi:uncharacterized protein YndB with AHSA1/START domain
VADIFHDLIIRAPVGRVFPIVSTPAGLDLWWTKTSAGTPALGSVYELSFGPEHDWRAKVSRCAPNSEFELELVRADEDWQGTRVGFQLDSSPRGTLLRFRHTGWPRVNDHYRVSCHCWAMYLRVLRRHLEHGESVPYEARLDV